jgi:prepilin-type N-terminal cleavage/methylation domain-containing protein
LKRNKPFDCNGSDAGFSLIELGIVMLVIAVVSGVALVNVSAILPGINANTAMYQTIAQLRAGREMAIAQRRDILLNFLGDNQIQLLRVEIPAGTTLMSTVTLENGIEFRLFGGVPDSPDSFGNGAAVDFGAATSLVFLSDGTLVDENGNPLNGSVYLGLADHPETARAVTILGATGRVRGYRWTGDSWIQ